MNNFTVSQVFNEILNSRLHVVIGVLVLWGLIGAVAGIILSIVASWLLSRLGAFQLAWKYKTWLKVAAIGWIIVACTILACLIGLIEGGMRGMTIILNESQFRQEVLVPLGKECAEGIASADCYLEQAQQRKNPNDPLKLSQEQEAFLCRFREQKAEMNVPAFLEHMKKAEDVFIQEIVRDVMTRLRKNNTIQKGSLTESTLEYFIPSVIRWGIRQKAEKELDKLGVREGVVQFFEKLPDAAAASGDPATITFSELAAHSIDNGAVPAIIYPIGGIAGAKKVFIFLLSVGAVFLPVFLFALGRHIERRKKISRSSEPFKPCGDSPNPEKKI